jgi:hypothetical protein
MVLFYLHIPTEDGKTLRNNTFSNFYHENINGDDQISHEEGGNLSVNLK